MIHWGDLGYADQMPTEKKSVAKIFCNLSTATGFFAKIFENAKRNFNDPILNTSNFFLKDTELHSKSDPVIIEIGVRTNQTIRSTMIRSTTKMIRSTTKTIRYDLLYVRSATKTIRSTGCKFSSSFVPNLLKIFNEASAAIFLMKIEQF